MKLSYSIFLVEYVKCFRRLRKGNIKYQWTVRGERMDKIEKLTTKVVKQRPIKILIRNSLENDIMGMAAQLAYFFLLSLFPLLLFMFSLLPYLPIDKEYVLSIVRDAVPTQSFDIIATTITEVLTSRSGGLLSIGMIVTLWSASGGINATIKALNRAYKVKESRSFFVSRSLSIVLTIAMIFVLLLVLILPIFGEHVGNFIFSIFGLSQQFERIWNILRFGLTPVVIFVVFSILYYIAPNKHVKVTSILPGAIFATIGWIVASFLLSFYVGHFGNYNATYGSLGGIIILMLWFYISGIILILGGEINAAFFGRREHS